MANRLLFVFVCVLPLIARARTQQRTTPESVAREVAYQLVEGSYDAALQSFDESLRRLIDRAQLAKLMDARRSDRAPAMSLELLRQTRQAKATVFTFRSHWARGGSSEIQLTAANNELVSHFQIWDDDDQRSDYRAKTSLRPPFRGTWVAGNASRYERNHHYDDPSQRYAIDWVIRGSDGKTYRTDGRQNSDYYAYGQDVLSPAAGVVVAAVNDVPDNALPGIFSTQSNPGNYVTIDLGNHEYAMLMHLMRGSIRVSAGQRITAGYPIGRAGNSGHCTEPTLEFQLADAPQLERAHSLPARFKRVMLDGEQAREALPVYGTRLAAIDHWDPHAPVREEDDD